MKKTFIVVLLLTFGLIVQVKAANTGANQKTTNGQVDSSASVNAQAEDVVQTQQQNQVMNQGEDTQIQTQQQNEVKIQGEVDSDDQKGKGQSEQRRSQVANAVHLMLQVAEREGGIGQQVRIIAQSQNQNQIKLEQNIEKIQDRGKLVKFLIGPNHREIKDAQKTLEQNREQIKQLNQIANKLSNSGDQQQLREQVRVLEQSNQAIENLIVDMQSGFSLFGWLNKLIS